MTIDANIVRDARCKAGISATLFAKALGYRLTKPQAMRQQVYDMEAGRKAISPQVARLCEMFMRFGVPEDLLKGERK